MRKALVTALVPAALAAAVASSAAAQQVQITVENITPDGGVALTPLFVGLHDGSFDVFDPGQVAPANGIEQIAELGGVQQLSNTLADAQPGSVSDAVFSPDGPPPFSPGQINSLTLDASGNRFLNFAGMVVPSNDLFVGNPEAIELFDESGNFVGPAEITLTGANVWDAGTEANDVADGPAFVTGIDAGAGTSTSDPVSLLFDDPAAAAYVSSIVGLDTPIGEITAGFDASTPLYRISISQVPEPASLAGLGLLGLALRRRR